MIGLNGFERFTEKKTLKNWARFKIFTKGLSKKTAQDLNKFWAVYPEKPPKKPRKNWAVFERFFVNNRKTAQTAHCEATFWA